MAIMHARWMGIVNDDIEFTRDDNGNVIYCTFSIRAREHSEWIPIDVYISDYQLITECEIELVPGCTVLIHGIMDISFHIIELNNYTTGKNLFPVITSDMTVMAREMCIINLKKMMDYAAEREKAMPVEPKGIEYHEIDIDEELPF